MKKYYCILSFLFLIPVIGNSQSHSKNTLSFNVDYDLGLHGTVSEYYYNNLLVDQDTSAAGTKLFRFDVQYNVLKFLSVGLNYRKGSYIEDPDLPEGERGNQVSMFGLGLRLYPVNKEKFALYFGLNYGASSLTIYRSYTFITTTNYRYEWKSPNFNADFGFNWYFGKGIGMNFSLGYSGNKFDLKNLYANGSPQDLTNQKHTFITKGVHVGIGLAIRLLGDKE